MCYKLQNPLFAVLFFCLAIYRGKAADVADFKPQIRAFDSTFSTNWEADVMAALPAEDLTNGTLDFQTATNLLCQESQRGNNAAQALFGFALLVQSRSPDGEKTGLELLTDSAENGYVPAMLNLGDLSEQGRYVLKNYNQAFHWYGLAAAKGNAYGQLELGGCYQYGLGVTPDFSKAAQHFGLSAAQTNYVAMKSLGYLWFNGLGVDKDLTKAKYWFTRAATEGDNRRAMYNLGVLSSLNFPDTNAMTEAFQWYKKSAELGDALACMELADCYYRGWGVETNVYSYRYWRFKAAFLGDTDAQYFMGQAYRTGDDGVPKDPQNSLIWYGRAAAKNDPRALYDLALHYLADQTNPASATLANDFMLRAARLGHREAQFQWAFDLFKRGDYETGKDWLEKSGENGWPKAEFALFEMNFNGLSPTPGCPPYPKDETKGIQWLRLAAGHNELKSQAILGVMLIRGNRVEKDPAAAEKLLRYAAEHGYASAQNDLGFAILNGDIDSADPLETAVWCELAELRATETNTVRRAKINVANALAQMKADQQLEVARRVKAFQPLPPSELDPMTKGWEKNPAYERENGQFGH